MTHSLIERLEKLQEPDREVDGRIAFFDPTRFKEVAGQLASADSHSWKCFAGIYNVPELVYPMIR